MIESFFEPEVREIVGAELVSEEGAELFVLPEEGVFKIHPEDVMAMFDLFERRVELAFEFLGDAAAKDLGDFMCGHFPEAHLARALEDFMNREIPFKNEIAAKFDLLNGVEAPQFHGLSLAFGELGTEDQGPVFEPIADDFWTQAIRGCLQRLGIGNGQEGIVVLAEGDPLSEKFLLHKGMTIDVVGGLEGEKDATRRTMGPRTSSRR